MLDSKMTLNFIETKEGRYLISDYPASISDFKDVGFFLLEKDNVFLAKVSEENDGDYVKAYRIAVEDIVNYGTLNSVKEYKYETKQEIIKNGIFEGEHLFKMV